MNVDRLRPLGSRLAGVSGYLGQALRMQRMGLRSLRSVLEIPLTISWKTRYSTLYTLPNFQRKMILWGALFAALVIYVGCPLVLWWLWSHYPPWLVVPVLLVANAAAGDVRQRRRRPIHRRGFDRLMVEGGVIPAVKEGRQPKIGQKIGSPYKDEFGVSQKFRINGATYETVLKKSDTLAGICGVPATLFNVEHDVSDPPNVFTIWIGKKKPAGLFEVPEVSDFHEPFRVGQTMAGRSLCCEIYEYNTLIGGIPGMGKTATVRQFILRNLLDPEGKTYLVDGKGSKKDYKDAIFAYSGYVDGIDDDALDQVEMLLSEVHDEVNKANNEDRKLKILVVLDEWQDIRSGADKDQLKRVDKLIERITKKGRATGVHILLATQRASAVSIPTELRSLFRQAIAFRQKNGTDYAMVLGHAPDVEIPSEPGEAIVMGDRGQVFGIIDYLSQEEWLTAVAQLAPRDQMSLSVQVTVDPVAHLVRQAAHKLTEERVTTTMLWETLDSDVLAGYGIPNTAALGRFLGVRGITTRNSAGRYYLRAELLNVK